MFRHKPAAVSESSASRFDDIIDDWPDDDAFDELVIASSLKQSPYFTQPTQVVHRTTLQSQRPREKSPEDTVIEVPASSPYVAAKQTCAPVRKLAPGMAPRGTVFRPPQVRPPTSAGIKKDDPVVILDDDDIPDLPPIRRGDSSDDDEPMRGDIRPSTFVRRSTNSPKRQTVNKAAGQTIHAKANVRLDHLSRKLYQTMSGKFELFECREAVQRMNYSTDDARQYLMRRRDEANARQEKQDAQFGRSSSYTNSSDVSPASESSKSVNVLATDADSMTSPRSVPSSPAALQTPTPKPRRLARLVQGRRPRPASQFATSSPVQPSSPLQEIVAVERRDRVITVISDDENDAALSEDELSREPMSIGTTSRVLSLLNEASVQQLIAVATTTEQIAKSIVDHRPYRTIEAARRVSLPSRRTGKQKSSRIEVGEAVVRAIENFFKAMEGIDHIVSICEHNGGLVKSSASSWELDSTGRPRSGADSPCSAPLTPLSGNDQPAGLTQLPVPKEPGFMQGHCTMKSYQLYGLNWMRLLYTYNFGGILADDMGLGKTCQVISLISHIVEDYDEGSGQDMPWPNLIVVPPSTLANWQAEFERFAPGVKVTLYSGPQHERDEIADEILDDPAEHHVVLTSYSQLSRPEDIANLRNLQANVAVFDEGHKLKNPTSKLYKDLLRIVANWRLLLTGTPVQNNLMEMVALLNFVEPSLFSEHIEDLQDLFKQKVTMRDVSNGALLYSERVAKARVILEPFILQRRKEQVLNDIPAKINRVIYCEMGEEQRAIYKEYETTFKSGPAKVRRNEGRGNDQNNVWFQLRKAAIHPQLFRRYFNNAKVDKMARLLMDTVSQEELRQSDLAKLVEELQNCSDFELHLWCRDYPCLAAFDVPDDSWLESAKVEVLLDLIRQFQANGDRVLVFTRFAKVLEILSECLAAADVNYLSLQGSTDVAERQGLIDQFNGDASIAAFVLTTASGGMGINLTAANKVVIFDQSDNPMDDIQAENRAHRLGQEREVEVIRLISKGTVEELVYAACQKKIELANRVTGRTAEEEETAGGESGLEMTSAQVEAQVRSMLQAGGDITPPSSD